MQLELKLKEKLAEASKRGANEKGEREGGDDESEVSDPSRGKKKKKKKKKKNKGLSIDVEDGEAGDEGAEGGRGRGASFAGLKTIGLLSSKNKGKKAGFGDGNSR